MYKKRNLEMIIGIIILNYILLGSGYMFNSQIIINLGILFTILICLVTSIDNSFMMILSLISMNNLFIVQGTSIRGIIYLIPAIKILFSLIKKRSLNLNEKKILACFMIICCIETYNELILGITSSLINILCGIFFFYMYLIYFKRNKNKLKINDYKISLIFGCLFPLILMLIRGGGVYNYNNTISYYRFGQESVLIGGPMGAVIYTSILISISIINIFINNNRFLYTILLIFSVILGLLTVSRTFLVIMIFIVITLLIYLFIYKKITINIHKLLSGNKKRLFIFVTFVTLIITLLNLKFLGNIIFKFTDRMTGIFDDPRIDIAIESITYLIHNPKYLLIGLGNVGYQIIGEQNNLLFSMYTHNIYLDILMSWGVIGLITLLYTIYLFFYEDDNLCVKKNILYYIPLVAYLVNCLFGGTFNYLYNYALLLFLLLFIKGEFKCQSE